jgi:hypothetical protein
MLHPFCHLLMQHWLHQQAVVLMRLKLKFCASVVVLRVQTF